MPLHFRNAGSRHIPTRLAWPVVLVLLLVLPACSSWRDSYLNGALQNASPAEVAEKLGEPWKKKTSLLKGQSIWIYRYALTRSELDPMGLNTLGESMFQATQSVGSMVGLGGGASSPLQPKSKPHCFHYVLTFNQKTNILQRWVREACADTAL